MSARTEKRDEEIAELRTAYEAVVYRHTFHMALGDLLRDQHRDFYYDRPFADAETGSGDEPLPDYSYEEGNTVSDRLRAMNLTHGDLGVNVQGVESKAKEAALLFVEGLAKEFAEYDKARQVVDDQREMIRRELEKALKA